MFDYFWNNFLFKPLFNLLIFLYYNYTFFNLGLAVVYLTIILRIILLPLSIISEKSGVFYRKLALKVEEIEKDYENDPIKAKEVIRRVMKKNKVRPWATMVVLGIQLLVLILLYQVFIGGINKNFTNLYPFLMKPDFVNTKFLWFDIGQKDYIMCIFVAIVLFVEITITQHQKKELLVNRDYVYRFIFPIFTFVILATLPSVKAIFILTSILFSFIIIAVSNLVWLVTGKLKMPEPKPSEAIKK